MARNTTSSAERASDWLSRPLHVVLLALAASAAWALYAVLRFPPEKATLNLVYHVPIVFPFVTFLIERSRSARQAPSWSLAPDSVVLSLAMWRIIGDVPLVSGHALFLSYAVLTSRTRITRFAAMVVLLETLWLKLIVWHDSATLGFGLTLGLCFALVHWLVRSREAPIPVFKGTPN